MTLISNMEDPTAVMKQSQDGNIFTQTGRWPV